MNNGERNVEQEWHEATKDVSGGAGEKFNLTTSDVSRDASAAMNLYQDEQNLEKRPASLIEGDLMLRLEVEGSATPLLIQVERETILGRRDPSATNMPNIDLTPFGGYQMGISRRHAAIRLLDQRLDVLDLGSRNGTFLNGERLKPHQPIPLIEGDELRLGKIALRIYFQR